MLFNLSNKLGTTLYIQIWEKRIKATDIKTKNIYDEQPYVAIETTDKNQKNEGGLTEIETRAFRELAYSTGVREVFVYEGKELSINSLNNTSIELLLEQ